MVRTNNSARCLGAAHEALAICSWSYRGHRLRRKAHRGAKRCLAPKALNDYGLRNSAGSLVKFAAMRRAFSRLEIKQEYRSL